MSYIFYLVLGVIPSLIWLSFYLKKDAHPEPKKTVLKIFFLGMGAAALAALIENLILIGLSRSGLLGSFTEIVYLFLGVALTEEFLKYLAVKNKYFIAKNGVLRESEFDEPVDVMLYMIISALGFAALENIFLFFSENLQFLETFLIALLRFAGATFLHALCSGILGLFMAFSFFDKKRKRFFLTSGFFIATLLHGLFNFFIIKTGGNWQFFLPLLMLGGLAVFVSLGFKKLKKMASVCKVNP